MSESVNNHSTAAAISMLSAMAIIGLIDNFVSVIATDIGVWQFHALRSTFMIPLLLGMAFFGLGTIRPNRWRRVFARATVLSVSMLLYFGALGIMPISQALAGLFTSPIFVLLINVFLMGKRIGPWRVFAVFMGFGGILLVLQPGGAGFGPAMVMPVLAGFFYAISAIATRSWCAGESALSLLAANMMMLGLIGLVVSTGLGLWGATGETGFLTRGWTWDLGAVLPWIVVQAAGSVIGVFLIIRAYQLDEPTNVAVFEYSVMIFGPGFAWLILGQPLEMLQGIGIALISASGIIISLRSK